MSTRNAPKRFRSIETHGVLDEGTGKARPALSDRQKLIEDPGFLNRRKAAKKGSRKALVAIGEESYRRQHHIEGMPSLPLIRGELTIADRAFARLLACGMSRKKATTTAGLTSYRVGQLKRDEVWSWYYREEVDKFADRMAAMALNDPARARLSLSAERAADRLDRVLDRPEEGSDANAIRAADVVLKHAVPKEESGGGGGAGVVINISGEKNSMLDAIEGQLVERGDSDGEEEEARDRRDEVAAGSGGEVIGDIDAGIGDSGVKPPRF